MLKIPDIIHVQSNKNTEKYLTHQELNIEAEPRFLSKFTYLKPGCSQFQEHISLIRRLINISKKLSLFKYLTLFSKRKLQNQAIN